MRGRGFRYVSHTADIAFIAKGESIGACIENACAALLNSMFDLQKIRSSTARVLRVRITESAASPEYLTWFTLQHILEEIDEKRLNAFEFRIERFFEKKGALKVYGSLYYKKLDEDCTLLSIKAVTPSGMKMTKRNGEYRIKVIADV